MAFVNEDAPMPVFDGRLVSITENEESATEEGYIKPICTIKFGGSRRAEPR